MSEKMTTESNDPERRDSGERSQQAGGGNGAEVDGSADEGDSSETSAGEGESADSAAAESAEAASPEERLAEAEKQAAEFRDKWMRVSADLENHRRRARRDIEDARSDATKRTLGEVLPVVDNLERALQHAEGATSEEAKGIAEGVSLVMRQFSQALERLNVQPIEAEGKPFDPAIHEAMQQVETDEVSPGAVAQVLQRGYTLGEQLLRPALVVVAKAPSEPEESPGPNGKSPGPGEDA